MVEVLPSITQVHFSLKVVYLHQMSLFLVKIKVYQDILRMLITNFKHQVINLPKELKKNLQNRKKNL